MSTRLLAPLLALLVLLPATAARADGLPETCVDVTLMMSRSAIRPELLDELEELPTCNPDEAGDGILLMAKVTTDRVSGLLQYAANNMRVVAESPASSFGAASGGPAEGASGAEDVLEPQPMVAPSAPGSEPRRVTLHFNVSWAGDCSRPWGDYHLLIDGKSTSEERVDPIGRVCTTTPGALDPTLASLRAIVEEVVGKVPALDVSLDEVLEALAPLADAGLQTGPEDEGTDGAGGDASDGGGTDGDGSGGDDASDGSALTGDGVRLGGTVDGGADPENKTADASGETRAKAFGYQANTSAKALPPPAAPPAAPAPQPQTAPPEEEPVVVEPARAPVVSALRPPVAEPQPASSSAPAVSAPMPRPRGDAVSVQAMPAGVAPPDDPGAAVTLAATGAAILLFLGFALYQRIGRPKALDHPVRAKLHAACLASGQGATVRELAEAVGISTRSAEYHLRYLARLKLLREDVVPGQPRRFAPPTATAPQASEPLEERVREALARRPGLSTGELSQELDVKYGRLDRLLKEMLCAGQVESRVDAGRRAYYPADERAG